MSVLLTQQCMTVQDRKVSTVFRSQTREEIFPLDNDSKKDLETHRVIDLLPDRTVATATAWFKAHPAIKLVSRDRSTDYALAATLGAPQAVQVADRWHLVRNLADALEVHLARYRPEIRLSRGGAETNVVETLSYV